MFLLDRKIDKKLIEKYNSLCFSIEMKPFNRKIKSSVTNFTISLRNQIKFHWNWNYQSMPDLWIAG